MDLAGVKQMLEQENELHEEALKKNRELIACIEDYLGGSLSPLLEYSPHTTFLSSCAGD